MISHADYLRRNYDEASNCNGILCRVLEGEFHDIVECDQCEWQTTVRSAGHPQAGTKPEHAAESAPF